jgi:hypothetical protein
MIYLLNESKMITTQEDPRIIHSFIIQPLFPGSIINEVESQVSALHMRFAQNAKVQTGMKRPMSAFCHAQEKGHGEECFYGPQILCFYSFTFRPTKLSS